jgi:GDPmannose 4,6-dehydratase
MNKKVALITGITGQDGSYLAELLLQKNYEVHGIIRRSSSLNTQRIDHLRNKIIRHYGDVTDSLSLINIIHQVQPTEIYNLAAQSHVKVSFEIPELTGMIDGLGSLKILESVRVLKLKNKTKIYQASTSEMFGKVQETPQKETTPFYPRSPYGVAKLYAHWITKNYRESYGLFACSGILFNHESPRRGFNFVTKKVVDGYKNIKLGKQNCIYLGNLDAKRDWGHAKDYVNAMWLMLQQEIADDYVIATGEQYSVREFVSKCAPYFGMDIKWEGLGKNEIGIDTISNSVIIRVDSNYFRPTEVDSLLGDATKAKTKLGWKPQYSFDDLVKEMCTKDQ